MSQKKQYIRFRYSEDQLKLAIDEIRSGKISQNAASKKYGIPKATLNNKIRNIVPLERKMGPSPVLSETEEKRLEDWIIAKAKLGFPMHHNEVQLAVQNILKASHRENLFHDDKPGRKWLKLFLKRRPSIVERNTEIISKARAAVTEETIRDWFKNLKEYLRKEDLEEIASDPTRIYNADETGMQFCPKTGKLLGPKNYKDFYVVSSGPEKESMTVLCNFSAAGIIVPPMIIVPYRRVPRDVAFSIPDAYFLGRSESGWMVSETFYEYITNCFYPWLLENNIKFPVLLFLDGHKSHINVELFDFCIEKSILLYCLPPNATHIIQPCDVTIFKPLKTAWKQVVQNHKQTTNKYITKSTFAPLFQKAFDQAINENTIKNGFRCCGLYPLDPDAVNYSKTMSFRRNEIFTDQQQHEKPTSHELRATLKVLNYYCKDQVTDKNSEIYRIYQRCNESVTVSDEDHSENGKEDPVLLTNSMIDGMPIEFDDVILFPENRNYLDNPPLDDIQMDKEVLTEENNNLKRETEILKENNTLNVKIHDDGNSQDAVHSDIFNLEDIKGLLISTTEGSTEQKNDLETKKSTSTIATNITQIITPNSKMDDNLQEDTLSDGNFFKMADNTPFETTDIDKETLLKQENDLEKEKSSPEQCKDSDICTLKTDDDKNTLLDKFLKTDCDTVSTNCDIKNSSSINDPKSDILQDSGRREVKINILSDITLASSSSNCQSVEDIWKKHLHWPKIEEKKNGKNVKNLMPFALVSREWKEYHNEKEKKKD